jgi:SAM-dependent methyltransferase
MDGLYDDAELYDLVSPPDPAMEHFYLQAGGTGRRVLELACGTGRFALPLAISGADVLGGDLSETMLTRARSAAAESGLGATFVRVDMRDFHLGRMFDFVIVAANSLMHLHTLEDFARAFTAIGRHLAPNGKLLFDVFAPSLRLLTLPAGHREPLGVFLHSRLGAVTIEETIAYDPATQVMRTDWYWSTAEQRDFRHTQLELRQIFPQELPLLLDLGGLKLVERHGDFDRSPFGPDSWRQVCVAVRA